MSISPAQPKLRYDQSWHGNPRRWITLSEEHPPTSDVGPKQKKPFFDEQQLPAGSVSKFLFGFLGGVGVSAIIWILGGRYVISESGDFVLPLIFVGGFKLVTSVILILQSRRFRPLGIGLLGSAPIGAWIAFAVCAGKFGM